MKKKRLTFAFFEFLIVFQLADVRFDGFAESFEIVAAFETRNYASAAGFVSPLFDGFRQRNKVRVR